MEKPIITTKDTNKVSKISALLSAVIDIVFLVVILSIFKNKLDSTPKYLQNRFIQESIGILLIALLCWGAMMIYAAIQYAGCRTYVDVYEEKIQGMGMVNGYKVMVFDLSYQQITSVTYSGINLYVNTPAGKYKIVTDQKTAQEVCNHFSGKLV